MTEFVPYSIPMTTYGLTHDDCPACEGYGYTDDETGHGTLPIPGSDITECEYCQGSGVADALERSRYLYDRYYS